MPSVDDYIDTVTPPQQRVFSRIRDIVLQVAPAAAQGRSYGMPAFIYKGKPLISFIARKKHLSIYPFSGKVVDRVRDKLKDYSLSAGAIRFSEENPIEDSVILEIVVLRLREIEA